jgi:hypothetical protein
MANLEPASLEDLELPVEHPFECAASLVGSHVREKAELSQVDSENRDVPRSDRADHGQGGSVAPEYDDQIGPLENLGTGPGGRLPFREKLGALRFDDDVDAPVPERLEYGAEEGSEARLLALDRDSDALPWNHQRRRA